MSGVRIPNGAPDVSWLVGQEVKTLASHAGNMGSIPVRVTRVLRFRINFLFEYAFLFKSVLVFCFFAAYANYLVLFSICELKFFILGSRKSQKVFLIFYF